MITTSKSLAQIPIRLHQVNSIIANTAGAPAPKLFNWKKSRWFWKLFRLCLFTGIQESLHSWARSPRLTGRTVPEVFILVPPDTTVTWKRPGLGKDWMLLSMSAPHPGGPRPPRESLWVPVILGCCWRGRVCVCWFAKHCSKANASVYWDLVSLAAAGQGREFHRCSTRHRVPEEEARGQGRNGTIFTDEEICKEWFKMT